MDLNLAVLLALISSVGLTSGMRTEEISQSPRYIVSWEIVGAGRNASVVFDIQAESTGFIGFGISKTGGMGGADLIIGGVSADGTAYFSDRYATTNGFPAEDNQQDWFLLAASENSTHTSLKFSRLLDTCDAEHDIIIKLETLKFIWSVGQDDNIGYHGTNRGAYAISILGEPYPEIDLSQFNSFDAVTNVTMKPQDTTYWCTVHKAPVFNGKQHAVAMAPALFGELSKLHSHHISLYICTPPVGQDPQEFFNKYIDQGGIDCLDREEGQISAYPYCADLVYTFTIGGRAMIMPEGVGFPIGQQEHMYYLMETHLDNPQSLPNVNFEAGVRIYYTSDLRPIEAGVMRIGQMYDYNFIVPPNSQDYKIVGHCSSNCTAQWVPQEGVNMFNVMLHSHAFGKKMKFRHYRDGTELPWIIFDENYDNNFQDNRNIQLLKLLPGDQLAIECDYDNTGLNPPGSVIGGFGTREEMCEVVSYYYPKMGLENCRSNIMKNDILNFFGIESVQNVDPTTNPIITAPLHLAGLRFLEFLDTRNWTQRSRADLQHLSRFAPQVEQCGVDGFQKAADADVYYVTYPTVNAEYSPPASEC